MVKSYIEFEQNDKVKCWFRRQYNAMVDTGTVIELGELSGEGIEKPLSEAPGFVASEQGFRVIHVHKVQITAFRTAQLSWFDYTGALCRTTVRRGDSKFSTELVQAVSAAAGKPGWGKKRFLIFLLDIDNNVVAYGTTYADNMAELRKENPAVEFPEATERQETAPVTTNTACVSLTEQDKPEPAATAAVLPDVVKPTTTDKKEPTMTTKRVRKPTPRKKAEAKAPVTPETQVEETKAPEQTPPTSGFLDLLATPIPVPDQKPKDSPTKGLNIRDRLLQNGSLNESMFTKLRDDSAEIVNVISGANIGLLPPSLITGLYLTQAGFQLLAFNRFGLDEMNATIRLGYTGGSTEWLSYIDATSPMGKKTWENLQKIAKSAFRDQMVLLIKLNPSKKMVSWDFVFKDKLDHELLYSMMDEEKGFKMQAVVNVDMTDSPMVDEVGVPKQSHPTEPLNDIKDLTMKTEYCFPLYAENRFSLYEKTPPVENAPPKTVELGITEVNTSFPCGKPFFPNKLYGPASAKADNSATYRDPKNPTMTNNSSSLQTPTFTDDTGTWFRTQLNEARTHHTFVSVDRKWGYDNPKTLDQVPMLYKSNADLSLAFFRTIILDPAENVMVLYWLDNEGQVQCTTIFKNTTMLVFKQLWVALEGILDASKGKEFPLVRVMLQFDRNGSVMSYLFCNDENFDETTKAVTFDVDEKDKKPGVFTTAFGHLFQNRQSAANPPVQPQQGFEPIPAEVLKRLVLVILEPHLELRDRRANEVFYSVQFSWARSLYLFNNFDAQFYPPRGDESELRVEGLRLVTFTDSEGIEQLAITKNDIENRLQHPTQLTLSYYDPVSNEYVSVPQLLSERHQDVGPWLQLMKYKDAGGIELIFNRNYEVASLIREVGIGRRP